MSKHDHTFAGQWRQVTGSHEKFKVHEDTLHARAGDHVFEFDGDDGIVFVVSHDVYERLFAPKKAASKSSS